MKKGRFLKAARIEAGYDQSEVAEKLGVAREMVSRYENGKSEPPLDKLIILSNLYNKTIDYLVRGE